MAEEIIQDADEAPVLDDVDETPPSGDTDEPSAPRRDRVAERFAKLTRALAEKDREMYAMRGQIDLLSRQRQPEQPAEQPQTGQRPSADDYPDYDAYIEAVADWKAEAAIERREQKRREADQQAQQQATERTWNERIQAAQNKYDDWDEALEAGDVPVSAALREALFTSEQGADVLYYLAKNTEEAKKLAVMTPIAVARAIGRLEAKLSSAPPPAAVEAEEPPEAPPPAARPVRPVGAGGSGTTRDPGQMSYQEYKAWRQKTTRR